MKKWDHHQIKERSSIHTPLQTAEKTVCSTYTYYSRIWQNFSEFNIYTYILHCGFEQSKFPLLGLKGSLGRLVTFSLLHSTGQLMVLQRNGTQEACSFVPPWGSCLLCLESGRGTPDCSDHHRCFELASGMWWGQKHTIKMNRFFPRNQLFVQVMCQNN